MKKVFIHFCLSLLMFSMAVPTFAGEPTGLHLFFADGSDKWFLFTQQPVVTFSKSELTISTSDATFTYTFDDVAEFQFGNPDPDVITGQISITPRIVHHGNTILIYGTRVDAVCLYELSGRKLAACVQRQGDAVSISLQSLPAGVYIIRINNQTIKVSKK